MTATMFEPTEAALKRREREQAFVQWRDMSQVGADTLKSMLPIVEKGACDLAEIDAQIGKLRGQIDAAVEHHAESTRPLQAELSDNGTTAQRRIAARSKVMDANAELESTIAPLKKLLEAAEFERQIAQGNASGRQVIENAYCRLGTEAEQERLKVLHCVEQTMVPLIESIRKKAGTFEEALQAERHRQKQLPERHRDSYQNRMALKEAELQANRWRTVAELVAKPVTDAQREREEHRKRRLDELYDR